MSAHNLRRGALKDRATSREGVQGGTDTTMRGRSRGAESSGFGTPPNMAQRLPRHVFAMPSFLRVGSAFSWLACVASCSAGASEGANSADGASDAPGVDTSTDLGTDAFPAARIDVAPEAGIEADASDSPTRAAPPDGSAGPCTAPLDTFNCLATYPASLQGACSPMGQRSALGSWIVSASSCGPLEAISYGLPPHFYFCLYDGADAGTLVGAGQVTDVASFCGDAAFMVVGGNVPSACPDAIYAMLYGPGADASMHSCDADAASSESGPD